MRRIVSFSRWPALGAVLCALVVVQPHVVERWALYLGSQTAPQNARLYLDPFPNAVSCESRVRLFRANAEPAFCAGRRELAFGGRTDAILAVDFKRLVGGAYCAPRRTRGSSQQRG
ncbi:MAG: hypothetical protein IAI50_12630 [Candidatus Eremiobacteraeota bacterium]|nr:hypothetical protein [Candidatus Eremiobacteraeota bacterium]